MSFSVLEGIERKLLPGRGSETFRLTCRSFPRRDLLLHFVSIYYIANLACIGLYPLLRLLLDWDTAPKRYLRNAEHMLYWEKRTGYMLLALGAGRSEFDLAREKLNKMQAFWVPVDLPI